MLESSIVMRRRFLIDVSRLSAAALTSGTVASLSACRQLVREPDALVPGTARQSSELSEFFAVPDYPRVGRPRSDESPVVGRVTPRLPTPDFSTIQGYAVGIRPYRPSGLRLEMEPLSSASGSDSSFANSASEDDTSTPSTSRDVRRFIVHNYGHGGAGITLAWGSAHEVLAMLQRVRSNSSRVAVVGAGVIGLTTAHVLAEAGHTVDVFAEHFGVDTTSGVAGGQWAPALVTVKPRVRFERMLRRSHSCYRALLADPSWGIVERDNYVARGGGGGLRRIPAGILPKPERIDVLPFAGRPRSGALYRTLLIEPPIFLPRLIASLESLGVSLVRRRFDTASEIATLEADVVVNCVGAAARVLFQDEQLVPIRGQLVHLPPQSLPYLLSHRGYIFPRRDAVVLGGSAERGRTERTIDERVCQRILTRNRRFFS